jgi:hypothetical protein
MPTHPSPPDPKPPPNQPVRVYEPVNKVRGAFDRRTYQRNYMRKWRARRRAIYTLGINS